MCMLRRNENGNETETKTAACGEDLNNKGYFAGKNKNAEYVCQTVLSRASYCVWVFFFFLLPLQ